MRGLHLTSDLWGCSCALGLLTDATLLSSLARDAVARSGLSQVADRFFAFPSVNEESGGVTGTVLLAESHVALHTWPESRSVTLDVYVCNYTEDNSGKAERLMRDLIEQFQPARETSNRLVRGELPIAGEQSQDLVEGLAQYAAFSCTASQHLLTERSSFQTIDVFETPQFGKVLRIDGANMTSERDEFFYHEALVHPVATAHPAPRSALIMGGGDGGAAEEVLKHASIERLLLVELDEAVSRISRAHLGQVHRGAFSDRRLELLHADGENYLQNSTEKFDLILLDLTDPDTPARRLYNRDFFSSVRRRLTIGGAMSLHIGSPVFHAERFGRLVHELSSVFANVRPYSLYVPLYGTQWGMAIASDALDPITLSPDLAEQRLHERQIDTLQYYNGEVHRALFALPNYIRKLLSAGECAQLNPQEVSHAGRHDS